MNLKQLQSTFNHIISDPGYRSPFSQIIADYKLTTNFLASDVTNIAAV
jgi:hypothetical protein